jgi:hypothetical protein
MMGFQGARVGVGEVELGLPAQPVADLTQLGRYGSARRPELGDGWVLWSVELAMLTGSGYYSTTAPFTDSDVVQEGDVCWIYNTSVYVTATGALTDFNGVQVAVIVPENSRVGAGTLQTAYPIFFGDESTLMDDATLTAWCQQKSPLQYKAPTAAPSGSTLSISAQADGAAGTLSLLVAVYMRVLPAGVPPLP